MDKQQFGAIGGARSQVSATGFTLGTAQASTSGTSIDFTSIPAGTKQITVTFAGVSTNGTSQMMVQIGDSGGVEVTGYSSQTALDNTTQVAFTTGFGLHTATVAANTYVGVLTLTLENSTSNTWVASGHMFGGTNFSNSVGSKSLSATLDRVRITTVNGTDAFDAGEINISYIG